VAWGRRRLRWTAPAAQPPAAGIAVPTTSGAARAGTAAPESKRAAAAVAVGEVGPAAMGHVAARVGPAAAPEPTADVAARATPAAPARGAWPNAARRAIIAAITDASSGPRPEAVLVLVNPRRMARLVLVAESRTRIGCGVT
jgi:hypothetical protein